MRTTLTIDDDVAAGLERLRKSQNVSLKRLINEALRRGLREITAAPKPRKPFRTTVVKGSRLLIPIDNVAEALAIAEGDAFR